MGNNITVPRSVSRMFRRTTPPQVADSNDEAEENPTGSNDLTASKAKTYLQEHPGFLENYIMDEIDLDQLERWMIRKTQRYSKNQSQSSSSSGGRKTSLSRWKFCVHADKREMLQELTASLQEKMEKTSVVYELANCIASAVNANRFSLYIAKVTGDPETLEACEKDQTGPPTLKKIVGPVMDIPNYVARTKQVLRMSKEVDDERFPHGFIGRENAAHILVHPIAQPDGKIVGVIEMKKDEENLPFHEEDEEICLSYLVWGGIALHYAHLFLNMSKQKKLNGFLLTVVKSIFQDMVSMDTLVTKIMNYAQRLVDADRASLFLVDTKSKELYPTIFDVGNAENAASPESDDSQKKLGEIRFPIGKGIAGLVALTGDVLNITNAYADPRFNQAVDKITGYHTNTILCMPIYIRNSIIGVVQMVNKKGGDFTKEDEQGFETFAVYCGLALHHAKLFDKIRRSEQKYKVALDVLSYHNTSTDEEVNDFLSKEIKIVVPDIDNYYLNPFEYSEMEKIIFATHMFIDLFGLRRFDKSSLTRFTLTIRKNYRRVPYHNWSHGFSVANTMYSLIKSCPDAFRPVECLSLFIGSLCHDLDHRGKNNKFMLDTESPLAAIYSTSTMEHHHFNQTVTILQQEGHNIFSKLSSSEYKKVLGLVKHCILATDLALFFPNRAKIEHLIVTEKFTWTSQEHRMMVQALAMTASDLSASAKPWEIQAKTVKVIFEEFYDQGDAERAVGRVPMPMMDRNQPEEQANSQVGFLTGICIPCYKLLHRLIPESKPLLDMCQANLERWKEIAEEVKADKEGTD